ncbi:MAG: hypothetical protein Q9210_002052 [Variospora velana]
MGLKLAGNTYTFLSSVKQVGYTRSQDNRYARLETPPVQYEYSLPSIGDRVQMVDPSMLENIPAGRVDPVNKVFDGNGHVVKPAFGPQEVGYSRTNMTNFGGPTASVQGDGLQSVLDHVSGTIGLYEQSDQNNWKPFQPFSQTFNEPARGPRNLQYVDLTGDGVLDGVIVGVMKLRGTHLLVRLSTDRASGFLSAATWEIDSVFFADFGGDGLRDLVRIRNGEICYCPNLGYGRFGRRITMDNSPFFDNAEQFNAEQIKLADIDRSGTTDMIYFHRDRIRLYFNHFGNTWSSAYHLITSSLRLDDSASIEILDLLCNGTTCIVIFSSVPSEISPAMSYINLMGAQKPHLTKIVNYLGVSTELSNTSSTEFYLRDKRDGKPHVVDTVQVVDHISKNRFIPKYVYHHGYYDASDRELRGFGMVEHWDSEKFSSFSGSDDRVSYDEHPLVLPPIYTKRCFHLGILISHEAVSRQYLAEYFKTDPVDSSWLLADSVLPGDLAQGDEYEAMRTLKGSLLREKRDLRDSRIMHSFLLERDRFGHVLRELSIAYGRRFRDLTLPFDVDREAQAREFIIYTENQTTNAIDDPRTFPFNYHLPLVCGTRTRTLFRKDDLSGLLPFSQMGALAITSKQYQLAFNSDMISQLFVRDSQPFLENASALLTGYVTTVSLKSAGLFPASEPDDAYWVPSGLLYFPLSSDPIRELQDVRQHFCSPRRFVDPFAAQSSAVYDQHDLLVIESQDALGNRITVGDGDAAGNIINNGNDDRLPQPYKVTDANRNRNQVAFDCIGHRFCKRSQWQNSASLSVIFSMAARLCKTQQYLPI